MDPDMLANSDDFDDLRDSLYDDDIECLGCGEFLDLCVCDTYAEDAYGMFDCYC